MANLEKMIIQSQEASSSKPSILEAVLFTVTKLFASSDIEKSRLNSRNVRGIVRVIGTQSFIRARFSEEYEPYLDEATGNITCNPDCDDRVLSAVAEGVLRANIALNGKNRDELTRMLQAVNGSVESEEIQKGGIFRRFDY